MSLATSVAGISKLLQILQEDMRPSYAHERAVQIDTPSRAAKSLIGRSSGSTTLFSLFTVTGIFQSPGPDRFGLIALKSERFGLSIVYWCVFGLHSYNINSMKTTGGREGRFVEKFHPERLLEALNGKRGSGMARTTKEATETYIIEIRTLVDAWLASGRRTDGVETPKDRRLQVTPLWGMAALPNEQPTVFDAVQRWLIDNPPTPSLTNRGEVQMSLRQWLEGWTDPITAALSEARILFLLLMTSEAKYALFRCSHPRCVVYFILGKPRGEYKLGAVCPMHRRQQGTLKQRKQDRAEAVRAATEAFAAWPKLSASTRAKHKSAKDYVASKLKRFGVGSKWVTRNLTEISKPEVSTHA
jgi:hypothetical protein